MDAMTNVTAKVICDSKTEHQDRDGMPTEARVHFQPDYADGRNADWAKATPHLSLDMTLNGDVANQFEQGQRYTLTFTATIEEPDMSTDRAAADNPFEEDTSEDDEQARQDELNRRVERNEEFKQMRERDSNE